MNNEADHFEEIWTALGNSEAKCLAILCVDRTPQDFLEIGERFLQEAKGVWVRKNKHWDFTRHYIQTLEENGLVSTGPEGIYLTELGEVVGQPVAQKTLHTSVELPQPLFDTFGQTAKGNGESRAVTTRALILELLSQHPGGWTSTDRLSEKLEIPAKTIGSNLRHLDKISFVEYHVITAEQKGQVDYQLSKTAKREDVVIPHKRGKAITNAIADILFEKHEVNRVSAARTLHQGGFSTWDLNNLEDQAGRILAGFYHQGICERGELNFQNHSSAKITKLGESIYHRLIEPVHRATSGDDRLLKQFNSLPWRDRIQEALLRYQRSSGHFSPRSTEKQKAKLLELLRDCPNSRRKDIQDQLATRNGIFSELLEAGAITKVVQGSKAWYSLAAPQFNPAPSIMTGSRQQSNSIY